MCSIAVTFCSLLCSRYGTKQRRNNHKWHTILLFPGTEQVDVVAIFYTHIWKVPQEEFRRSLPIYFFVFLCQILKYFLDYATIYFFQIIFASSRIILLLTLWVLVHWYTSKIKRNFLECHVAMCTRWTALPKLNWLDVQEALSWRRGLHSSWSLHGLTRLCCGGSFIFFLLFRNSYTARIRESDCAASWSLHTVFL